MKMKHVFLGRERAGWWRGIEKHLTTVASHQTIHKIIFILMQYIIITLFETMGHDKPEIEMFKELLKEMAEQS